MRKYAIAMLFLAAASSVPATAAELGAANSLFVRAADLYDKAAAIQNLDQRAEAYAEVQGILERIVSEHPDSHLALLLTTGEPVGKLSLPLAQNTAKLARLEAVNIDKVLAELERSRAATQALRAQTESMRNALAGETTRVTQLLVEQSQMQAKLNQQMAMAAPDAETLRKLDAANAEIEALKKQKATITALLTSERDKSGALAQQVASLTASAAAASAAAKAAPATQAAASATTAGTATATVAPAQQAQAQPTDTQQAALAPTTGEAAEAAPEPKVTAEEIAAAIKQALQVGTERVVAQVGQTDGYNADPNIHIPLPPNLAQVAEMLSAMGLGGLTDDVELRMNRAAEAAAPQAAGLFGEAIAAMKVEDIQGIMNGPDDAATQYFEGAMSDPLAAALRPVIEQAMAEAGAIQAYDDMLGKYKAIPLVPDVKADLTEHATQAAMDGIFFYLAREEAAIRNDAVKRTTELLQKVFGT